MLYLIGVGLSKEDITLHAIDACKKCDYVFFERYTSFISDEKVSQLAKVIGKEPKELTRSELEGKAAKVMARAKSGNIAIITGGDPLIATTHKILFIEAKSQNIQTKIVHSSSILTAAIGESGLDFYRFGAVCTIPTWHEHYSPVSFYETIERNYSNNLHSLLLFDYDPMAHSSLDVEEAIRVLGEGEKHYKNGIIKNETKVFVIHKLGLEQQKIVFTTIEKAKKLRLSAGPALMILPASLTDIEKDIISSMHNVDV